MKHVVLIACASKKLDCPAPASELYVSDLFKKSLAYARSLKPDGIHILSALHHVLDLGDVVQPYNYTLNGLPASDQQEWADQVLLSLDLDYDARDTHYTILAGRSYCRYLTPHLPHHTLPLAGLGIGQQLKWLKEHTP